MEYLGNPHIMIDDSGVVPGSTLKDFEVSKEPTFPASKTFVFPAANADAARREFTVLYPEEGDRINCYARPFVNRHQGPNHDKASS